MKSTYTYSCMNFVDKKRKITEKLPKKINSRIFPEYLNE